MFAKHCYTETNKLVVEKALGLIYGLLVQSFSGVHSHVNIINTLQST